MLIHTVRRGDTIAAIAAMHGVVPMLLAADNGLAVDSPLAVGQAIVVRVPRTLHTIRTGDTLFSLARHYGLSVRTLLRRNFYLRGRAALRAGEPLVIDYEGEAPLARLGVNAYAYPHIAPAQLDALLPYLTYLTALSRLRTARCSPPRRAMASPRSCIFQRSRPRAAFQATTPPFCAMSGRRPP